MKRITVKTKGFTLLELIIALGIMAVVSAIILPFFLGNYKSLNETSARSELQHEAQMVNSLVSQKLMEVKEIKEIKDIGNLEAIDNNFEVNLKYLIYLDGEGKENKLELLNNKLEFIENSTGNRKAAGGNIESILIKPLSEGKTYKETQGLTLNIKFKSEKFQYSIENIIHFRNKSN